MSDVFTERLNNYVKMINSALERYKYSELEGCDLQEKIIEAMWYTLCAGGKRIRAVLVFDFCRMCGGNIHNALTAACAIEMIHAFSLIHDDLPFMDNDDFRRGKPSCHKAFGEAAALLAGDALENKAYEIIANDENLTNEVKVNLIRCLTESVGVKGMIGGQVIDTDFSDKMDSVKKLVGMYRMKTGALISAACKMGCICAGAYNKLSAAENYGYNLGTAFQVVDDILDVVSSGDVLGKPIGSDKLNEKNTFVSICGLKKSQDYAAEFTNQAFDFLSEFDDNEFMCQLTAYLLKRNK